MATHSSVLAWRIPGTGEPGGLPSMGLHRVGHDWSDLAAAISACKQKNFLFCNTLASIDVNIYIYIDAYMYINIYIHIFKGNRHQLNINFLLIYSFNISVHELEEPLLTILFYRQLRRFFKNLALKNVTWTLNYQYCKPWKNCTYSFSKHPIFLPSLCKQHKIPKLTQNKIGKGINVWCVVLFSRFNPHVYLTLTANPVQHL